MNYLALSTGYTFTQIIKMANNTAAKTKAVPSHPPVAVMVTAALKGLKDRKGSSLIAIKKYITQEYKVDCTKLAPFIKKFLKSSIENGKIVQTKGTGASGSFKIGKEEKATKEAKKVMKKTVKPPKAKTGKPTKKSEDKKAKTKKSEGKVKSKKSSAKKVVAKKTKTPKPKATKKAKTPAKKPKAAKKLAL